MDEELYHYGVPGMKHGVRRGPPYPIGSGKGSTKNGALDKKKSERAKKKKDAEKKRAAKKKAAEEAEREKILKSPKKLYKNRDKFTKEEIDKALKRFEWEKKLRDYSKSELAAPKERIDVILGYFETGIKGYNTAAGILNVFNDENNQLPLIKTKKEEKKRNKGNN